MIELLRTKLFIPRPRSDLVSRPRLTKLLNAGLDKKLTLISAPAGFGKTTLLSEWIPQSPHCVTWLSLDEYDNDPTRFWAYVIASLQQIHPDLGNSALNLLQSQQAPPITSILTALINDITSFPDKFSFVLDDYHAIDLQPIHEALSFLIAHLPANLHLVITTRADPPLPLARLRARDNLTELRANDLRFIADESTAFLTQTMGLSLSAGEVVALESRTEGWIAGLQIAALSLQGSNDMPGFTQAFSGSHRHILGYLVEEVINQRPAGTLSFLLQTSILERLCGSLCDAVTGDTGGQEILENLERANLFITPLDNDGVWYRYHRLFTDALQARLQRTQRDLLPELHRRAGIWYARQGMVAEAVRHALTGGDFEHASLLIEAAAGDLLRRGASASLIGWLDAIPDEIIRAQPRLCLVRGWSKFMGPMLSLESAEEWAMLALQTAQAQDVFDSGFAGEVAALRAMIAATRSEVAHSIELSLQALDDLPLESPWRTATAFCLGTAHYLSGDLAAAVPVFDEAMRLSRIDGAHFIEFASASFLAEILIFQGRLSRAKEMYEQVLAWTDPDLPQKGTVMAHGGLAEILCERNQLDDALAHIQLGVNQIDRVGGVWSAHLLYRVLARIRHAQGNWTAAFDALDRTYQTAQKTRVDLIVAQAAALRARLHAAQGNLEAAAKWAENCGLNPDDAQANHPGWREVEYLSLARVLAVQDKLDEAEFLLERLLNSAEEEGRFGNAIHILVVRALVNQAQGDRARALEDLERAIILAEPEGYIRVFVEEGDRMTALLSDYQSMIKQRISFAVDSLSLKLLAYTAKLIAEFPQSTPIPTRMPGINLEPLSQRELEILHLISAGYSNQEIADILVIANSTVKSHINNIYGKLGTHKRTQAVAIARDLDLLSDRYSPGGTI